jgi:hypothetical protein
MPLRQGCRRRHKRYGEVPMLQATALLRSDGSGHGAVQLTPSAATLLKSKLRDATALAVTRLSLR